jgi:DNA-binding response OmpR family regulator
MPKLETEDIVEVLLILNDEHESEMIVQSMKLAHFANQTKTISSGAEAIDFLATSSSQLPKIILLSSAVNDYSLGEMLKLLRENSKYQFIPTVVLSDNASHDEKKYPMHGVVFLQRPFQIDKFMAKVSEIGFSWIIVSRAVF